MIFDRKPETEKLIEILGRAKVGEEFSYQGLATKLGSPNRDIRPLITSARNYLEKQKGIVFGPIRGVGIQRMTANEIAHGGIKIVNHIAKQGRKGDKRNRIVDGSKDLSNEAQQTVIITNAIFEKLRQETKGVTTKIKIATIDGAEVLENIVGATKK